MGTWANAQCCEPFSGDAAVTHNDHFVALASACGALTDEHTLASVDRRSNGSSGMGRRAYRQVPDKPRPPGGKPGQAGVAAECGVEMVVGTSSQVKRLGSFARRSAPSVGLARVSPLRHEGRSAGQRPFARLRDGLFCCPEPAQLGLSRVPFYGGVGGGVDTGWTTLTSFRPGWVFRGLSTLRTGCHRSGGCHCDVGSPAETEATYGGARSWRAIPALFLSWGDFSQFVGFTRMCWRGCAEVYRVGGAPLPGPGRCSAAQQSGSGGPAGRADR